MYATFLAWLYLCICSKDLVRYDETLTEYPMIQIAQKLYSPKGSIANKLVQTTNNRWWRLAQRAVLKLSGNKFLKPHGA